MMAKRKLDFDKPVSVLCEKIDEMKRQLVNVESLSIIDERRLRELYERAINLCGNLRYAFWVCEKSLHPHIDNYKEPK